MVKNNRQQVPRLETESACRGPTKGLNYARSASTGPFQDAGSIPASSTNLHPGLKYEVIPAVDQSMNKALWMAAGAATALAGKKVLEDPMMRDLDFDRLDRVAEDVTERFGRIADTMFETIETHISGRFDSFSTDALTRSTRYRVNKAKDGVVIMIEVPGLTHDDVTVTLDDAVLTINATGEPMEGYTFEFNEQFRVSPNLEMKHIKASVKNGLLTVTLTRDTPPASAKGTVPISEG
jgi:HSP20 family molecular chaperone IbpA